MAFKKIAKNTKDLLKEEEFLNNARGDIKEEKNADTTSKITKKPYNNKLKRKYALGVYLSEEEMLELKQKAEEMKMNINQYIRFKIFINQNIKDF